MLKIQKHLIDYGLENTVDKFKLITKQKGNLTLFKYNQIDSPFSFEEVKECRGLILDSSNNWSVVLYPFHKFFNLGETNAHPIDWRTAKVFDKLDGSLISFYFHNFEWHVATSGTIDAGGNAHLDKSFKKLVIETIKLHYNKTFDEFTNQLNTSNYYMFELCTPFNIVVTPHKESKLYLLAIRNAYTLKECSINTYKDIIDICTHTNLNSVEAINQTFENMPWSEEGYVVCDANFNRIKIKNPAYVAVHHLVTGTSPYHIINIIKKNELEEFCTYFSERKDEIYLLKNKYDGLINKLSFLWFVLKDKIPTEPTKQEQKDYALCVFDLCDKNDIKQFSGLFFNLGNNKVNSVKEYIESYDIKKLYVELTK